MADLELHQITPPVMTKYSVMHGTPDTGNTDVSTTADPRGRARSKFKLSLCLSMGEVVTKIVEALAGKRYK